MPEKEKALEVTSVNIHKEKIPLYFWPSYLIEGYLNLNKEQSQLLNQILVNGQMYSHPDTNIAIFEKIFRNSTVKGLKPRIGTFFVLDFYNHKREKDEKFIRCYRDLYFYPEFEKEIVEVVRPLEEDNFLLTPEEFFSSLLVNNFHDENLKNQALFQMKNGSCCKDSLLSVINKL